jgi:hypothetical protein
VLALALAVLTLAPGDVPVPLGVIFKIAAADLIWGVRPEQRPYARYASLHGFDVKDRPEVVTALQLASNGASFAGDLVKLDVIAGMVVRFDSRALRWDRYSREVEIERLAKLGVNIVQPGKAPNPRFVDIWEDVAALEPYFGVDPEYGWIDPVLAPWVAKVAQSEKFIVSAHWLLPRLVLERQDGGFYSQLLLLPAKEEELMKRLGVDLKFADTEPRGRQGAAIVQSASVAYNPREIQVLQSSTGWDTFYAWLTSDYAKSDEKAKDPRQSPANTSKHDAREILFSLWNGLQGGYLANGQGVQQNIAPQQVAEDQRDILVGPDGARPYYSRTKSVVNYIKCLDCHGESSGFIGFSDDAVKLIAPPRLDTGYQVSDPAKYDPKAVAEEVERIEEFYRAGLQSKLAQHRASYEARVRACTGLSVREATRLLVKWYDRTTPVFAAELVTPEQAAREMGYPLEVARALWKASYDDQLGFLAAGRPVTRIQWEKSVPAAFRAGILRLKKAG